MARPLTIRIEVNTSQAGHGQCWNSFGCGGRQRGKIGRRRGCTLIGPFKRSNHANPRQKHYQGGPHQHGAGTHITIPAAVSLPPLWGAFKNAFVCFEGCGNTEKEGEGEGGGGGGWGHHKSLSQVAVAGHSQVVSEPNFLHKSRLSFQACGNLGGVHAERQLGC